MVRYNSRQTYTPVYTEEQVSATLDSLGIEITSRHGTDFIGYCPFHYNKHTPAFCISKQTGLWTCFNPACGERGSLEQLVSKLNGVSIFEARRVVSSGSTLVANIDKYVQRELAPPSEFKEFSPELIAQFHDDFWRTYKAVKYMTEDRHMEKETLEKYMVGYSIVDKNDVSVEMITIPMYDPTGMPVGLIGRSIEGKEFKNSSGLPRKETFFNLHRAKMYSTVIVVESCIDAMRIDQAGYPNVVAVLGGSLSDDHIRLLHKHFSTIIIMTDDDKKPVHHPNCGVCKRRGHLVCRGHFPGVDLGYAIQQACPSQRVLWACYSEAERYAHDAKDADDMTTKEIRQCISNAVSTLEFEQSPCARQPSVV